MSMPRSNVVNMNQIGAGLQDWQPLLGLNFLMKGVTSVQWLGFWLQSCSSAPFCMKNAYMPGSASADYRRLKKKKADAGRNQRALRKDPTVSAVTDHESHQYLN
eukprot:1158622-Pelagomonas_calceolata.AAC.4